MPTEPSVLDYLLAKLQFWKKSDIDFEPYLRDDGPEMPLVESSTVDQEIDELIEAGENTISSDADETNIVKKENHTPWRLLISLTLVLAGQFSMVEPHKIVGFAVFFYLLAGALLVWGFYAQEVKTSVITTIIKDTMQKPIKPVFILFGMLFLFVAFLLMGEISLTVGETSIYVEPNRFTTANLISWIIGIVFLINGLWVENKKDEYGKTGAKEKTKKEIQWFDILLILVAIIAIFFRTYLLDSVPAEMFSDHAEKLLDVQDVLDGQYSIFFPRNTGREAFQMYLSAFVAKILGVGIQFLTLKIGTVLCGLLMLPYVYLLGKEIANKRVGLYAVFLASIAYWPNVIARVGLRYILYAAFAAPTLYYFYRGLRRQHRNDFILAGIFLGVGLHGYSSFRFIPIVVIAVAVIYLLFHQKERRKQTIAVLGIVVIGIVSLAIFVPLLRYWLENPAMFSYRMATRLGTAETDYPGNPVGIFFSNFFKAMLMFFNDNGEVWVHSVTHRPALDWITAGFYFIGGLLMFLEVLKKRSWEYLSLLMSIPLLMMPSILSLAFPGENPCLNRPSAAMIPVFLVAGYGVDTLMTSMSSAFKSNGGKKFTIILTILLFILSARTNYDLVFNQYADQFVRGAWNTRDIGEVISEYANSIGSYDSAYVIPYPHWVDTRLVGITAGVPRKDYALSQDLITDTLNQEGTKLFIFKPEDITTLNTLAALYPEGQLSLYEDQYEGKDFYTFLVP